MPEVDPAVQHRVLPVPHRQRRPVGLLKVGSEDSGLAGGDDRGEQGVAVAAAGLAVAEGRDKQT